MKEEPHPKERALAMKKIYPDAVKEEPPGAPQPLGEPVSLTVFTDADHAVNINMIIICINFNIDGEFFN